ncbi:hypothetical protein CON59_27925 [Bacillus cereus]|nr:hypothetical protein CON59_27925 [Bacillus cereus]
MLKLYLKFRVLYLFLSTLQQNPIYYTKNVPKGVCFLETFQKWIFEVLELEFHLVSIVPKGVPFEMKNII